MSDELLGDMSEDELNAILESDDPTQIEAMLNGEESSDPEAKAAEVIEEKTDIEDKPTEDPEKKTEVEESAASSADESNAGEPQEQEGKFIEGKNGMGKIPYRILDEARKERNELKAQVAEMQQQLDESNSKSKKVSAYLEENGIDLSSLDSGEILSATQMEELAELDPAIAKLAQITMDIHAKQQSINEEISNTRNASIDPTELAIRENDDLSNWRKNDIDRWEDVIKKDDMLREHPEFKTKSLEERFEEAVRLTKLDFGDVIAQPNTNKQRESAEAIAAAKVAKATSSSVPRSLTDLGATPTTERSKLELLGDLNGDALVDAMENMTPDQIEAVLAQGYDS